MQFHDGQAFIACYLPTLFVHTGDMQSSMCSGTKLTRRAPGFQGAQGSLPVFRADESSAPFPDQEVDTQQALLLGANPRRIHPIGF